MSGIPLEYWTGGMGAAMPLGRADPAACERLRNAVEQYGKWSKQPDSPTSIAERARYRREWDELKAQRACRPAPPPAPRPAPLPYYPPAAAAAVPLARIPTWAWVAAGALTLLLAGGAIRRTLRSKRAQAESL